MKPALLIVALLSAGPAAAAGLIGAEVPPYPAGLSSTMGTCVPDGGDICGYAIATLENAEGDVIAIIAERKSRIVDGQPVSRVLDMVNAPELAAGQGWALGECEVGGRVEPAVVGIVNYRDMGGWIESMDTAWAVRFDPAVGKLGTIDAAGVKCSLPGS